MRVPLGWLAEWIDLPEIREDLEWALTEGGLEIEQVIRMGPSLDGFVVGDVLERAPHPDADRLSVCRVDLGGDEPLEIVCGAPNVGAGQKVVVAPHGVVLPDGTRIKRSKIRGVRSNGMICSTRELGLGDEHEGILVLDTDAAAGSPAGAVLPAGETVIDVEITPNRGDWVSMLGMAREVRAHFGGELRIPPIEPLEEAGRACADDVAVEITDGAGCHRYAARVVRGVSVGPSPGWLVARLEAAGLRSVSNVVDVTNLVMLEFGQPLHAFDLDRLTGRAITVRAGAPGEKLRTLDAQDRELVPGDLVIADEAGAIALAGVMGGENSEVHAGTTNLVLESAQFDPSRVRRTARRLGLHSDASYRFERGVDPEGLERAVDRAARLIQELAGGSVSAGRVIATGEPPPRTDEIVLEPARANRLLGTDLSAQEMASLLERVGIEARAEGDRLRCRPPSWRSDLHEAVDLVEEVVRIHGHGRVPETLPLAGIAGATQPPDRALREALRSALVGAGATEIMTLPFVPEADAETLRLDADDPRRSAVRIVNPMHAGAPLLRTTLVAGVLRAAQANLARQVEQLTIFELSRVFRRPAETGLPDEPLEAALLLVDGGAASLWEGTRPPAFFRAKGLAERVLAELGIEARFEAAGVEPFLHPGAAGSFVARDRTLAVVGDLHPDVAAAFDIESDAALLVIDAAALLDAERVPPRLAEVSNQPLVRRDLSVLLGREVAAGDVLEAIRKRAGNALLGVEVFDRYEGKGVPQGKVSLAFRLTFQRPDRTLTDSEVAKATDRVVHLLAEHFGGELR